jgi:hypothetical protein
MSRFAAVALLSLALAATPSSTLGAPSRDAPVRGGTELPEGSAAVLALLADVAQQRGGSPLARDASVRLINIPRARQLAGELVAKYDALSTAQRAALFPRVADPAGITRGGNVFEKSGWKQPAPKLPGGVQLAESLPPESPADGEMKGTLLSFAGVKVHKPADLDKSDEVAVYAGLIEHAVTYGQSSFPVVGRAVFPGQGAIAGLGAGATSKAGAGPLVNLPWGSYGGYLLVTAVLEDDGGSATIDAERLDLLLEAAMILAPTFPAADKLANVETALSYSLALLRIDDPKRWTAKSVQVRRISWADYTSLYFGATQITDGVTWRLKTDHDTKGGSYTAYFDVPVAPPPRHDVTVQIRKVEALGSVKDSEPGGLADLGAVVSIRGVVGERRFTPDGNVVVPMWSLSRAVLAGGDVDILIDVYEADVGASVKTWKDGGLLSSACSGCGDMMAVASAGCKFVGSCPPVRNVCDASPMLEVDATCGQASCKAPVTRLSLRYDPATGGVTGDVAGTKGQVLVATGNAGPRQVRVTFSVSHK